MAVIPKVTFSTASEQQITQLDLNDAGPHTFTFDDDGSRLVIVNNEAVPLTINLLGTGVTSFTCNEIGPVDVSGGYDLACPAGQTTVLAMQSRDGYFGDK